MKLTCYPLTDIVTLLWFRPYVFVHHASTLWTRKPVCFFIKLDRHVNHDERILEVRCQRSRSQWTYKSHNENKLVNMIKTKLLSIFIKFCRHVNYGDRINTIDFQVKGQGHNGHHWQIPDVRGCYDLWFLVVLVLLLLDNCTCIVHVVFYINLPEYLQFMYVMILLLRNVIYCMIK